MSDDNIVELKPKRGGRTKGTRPKGDGHKATGAGTGLPAMGAGWGGPAKGAGAPPVNGAESNPNGRPTNEAMAVKRQSEDERREQYYAKLDALTNSPTEGIALQAVVAMLNRLEGTPVNRSVYASVDDAAGMDDNELVAELDRTVAAIRKAGA